MIPCGHQKIDKQDIAEVKKVLESDFLTQGPKVKKFELALAKYAGAKYAVACNNGTAAVHLTYLAAGLKPGDQVIVSPNTFASPVNMLLLMGLKPIFTDIRLDTYNIDERKIEKLITKKTKAIIPTHFAGQSAAMDKISKIARKHKLLVITDACHALGAKYKKNKIGSCSYADMETFSFHPVKPITCGEGGAVLTSDKKLYQKLILFRNHGIYKDSKGKNVMVELGFNYRLTDFQAALGLSQLKKLDSFIKTRRQIVKWYQEEFANLDDIIIPQELPENYSGWHIYVIRTTKASDRASLMAFLKKSGIGANFHYPAVYSHPYYRRNGFSKTKLANEEIYQSSCITLPIYPDLKRKQVKYITDTIRKFYKNK
jgi:perosamine synthetase